MTKVNAAPHLLQHSLKAQKLSEKKVHWCQKKKERKKKKEQANNGLGFWASLYLHLVYLAPVSGESREVERLEISCNMTNNPFLLNNKSKQSEFLRFKI